METKASLIVGYLESWGNITFTQAAQKGYNAIVMAFGTITGDEIGIYDNVFAPSPTDPALKEDIKEAKNNGAKEILFSVGGGENNTYNPKEAPALDVAKAIVNFLIEFGFTGVDFDLEIDADATYLDELCEAIKNLDSSITITGAPQLNQNEHETDLFCVSTGNFLTYNIAIQNNRFDYLFIQAYNNQWPIINGASEADVKFISSAFINLKKSIPIATQIVIGEPANESAAGFSVYNNNDDYVYQKMADEYNSIKNDAQYGGIMTWSINKDAETDYQFVRAMKETVNV